MNKESFNQYIKFPELLDDRSLTDLEKIVEEFPYFQSAHLLLLKNLNNQGSIKYEKELKRTAARVNNREKLFFLLDKRVLLPVNEPFIVDEDKPSAKIFNQEIDFKELSDLTEFDEKEEIINDELSQLIMSGAAQSSPFFNVDDQVDLEDFKNTFKKSKPIQQKEESKSKRDQLIDKFIIDQPKINPAESSSNTLDEIVSVENTDDSEMITDTLAKIYIKQGFYDKAIHAYEKLSLKYPEKNAYFASQIKKIKEIVNNQ